MRQIHVLKAALSFSVVLGLCGDSMAGPESKAAPKPMPGSDLGRARPVPQPTIAEGPVWGGGGGDSSYHSCRHPYGIQVTASPSGVLRFGLRCENDAETVFWDLPVKGVATGLLLPMECPTGFEIAGFQGRSGTLIDAIGIICRRMDPLSRVWQDVSLIYGGGGGGDFSWECPKAYHVAGVRLRSGSQIDSLQIICEAD